MSRHELLRKLVIDASESSTWDLARREWDVDDLEELDDADGICVCEHQGLRYLYTIINRRTRISLYPIGSECIKSFGSSDMDTVVGELAILARLQRRIRDGEKLALSTEQFSREVLRVLYEYEHFPATTWNNWNPNRDYEFLLKMFNKRTAPSIKQQNKISAVLRGVSKSLVP